MLSLLVIRAQNGFNQVLTFTCAVYMAMSWGVMKVGNIVPRVGIEPTSLAFQANVLIITPHRLPDVITIPMPTCLCSSLPQRSVQTTTLVPWNCKPVNAYNYIHTGNGHTYTYTGYVQQPYSM